MYLYPSDTPFALEFYQLNPQVKAEKTPCGEADYQILGKLNQWF